MAGPVSDPVVDLEATVRACIRAVIEACAKAEGFDSYRHSDWSIPEKALNEEWLERLRSAPSGSPMSDRQIPTASATESIYRDAGRSEPEPG